MSAEMAAELQGTKTKTLVVVILDESGSMDVQKNDVIGGYNSFIQSQRDITADEARVILIKFNTSVTVAHAATSLNQVPQLATQSYIPSGGTALFDAVSEGIRIAEGAAQKEERVLVLIMTDGEENASRKATGPEVRGMITAKEALGNWTFAYIGENPEGWSKTMQQPMTNAIRYNLQHQNQNMMQAAQAVTSFRSGPQMQSANVFHSGI